MTHDNRGSVTTRRPRITIVSTNLSTNCTNRCYRLAQALAPRYEVRIVGTTFGVGARWGEGIWPPLADTADIAITGVRGDYLPGYLRSAWRLVRMMDGDLIIACKPRAPSLGLALVRKCLTGTPVILDVDDDEIAQTVPGARAPLRRKLAHPGGYYWTRLVHWMHRFADDRFVVSRAFQQQYGGTLVPHPMHPDALNPGAADRPSIRTRLGIHPEDAVVGFIGTPGHHKGTDLLARAISRIGSPRLRLLLVGAPASDPSVQAMCATLGTALIAVGPVPIAQLPDYLAAIDIVALPQRRCEETRGQMPAKLTDAMAMGKVIIASDTADIGRYLDGCGFVCRPGHLDDLEAALRHVLSIPHEWAAIGDRARQYFVEHLSADVVARTMRSRIDRLLDGAR